MQRARHLRPRSNTKEANPAGSRARHTAAAWSLHGGANVQQVRTMLGHRSLGAVERYLHEMPGTTDRSALDANHRARTLWDQPMSSIAPTPHRPESYGSATSNLPASSS